MYPLKTNRDMRKLRWQYSVKKMQRRRLPATVDRAVWKKTTRRRAGNRWERDIEKIWKEVGGNQDKILSIDEAAGYKTKVRDVIEKREKEMLRCKVDEEEHLRIYGGLRGDM